MIFKHKPVCNTKYVDAFPFDATTTMTSDRNVLMHAVVLRLRRRSRLCAPVPGQEFIQARGGVIFGAAKGIGQPSAGIDVVQLGGEAVR